MDHEQLVTEQIIGCAIEVHKDLGAGLLERPYMLGLCVELAHRGVRFERERVIALDYRGQRIGEYIPDLIVENKVVVEIKIINFNKRLLRDGLKRVVV